MQCKAVRDLQLKVIDIYLHNNAIAVLYEWIFILYQENISVDIIKKT